MNDAQRRRTALMLALAALLVPAAVRGDYVLDAAAKHLYSQREKGLDLLEAALAQGPQTVERWDAYVEMLDINGDEDFADWASRAALLRFPDHPQLLRRRIALLRGPAALDVVAQLAAVPGQEKEAALLRDLVRLDLSLTGKVDTAYATSYSSVARRLLYAEEPAAALIRADEGLALGTPWSSANSGITDAARNALLHADLLATKAVSLALLDRFDEALAVQAEANYPQINVERKFHGLGDVLLTRGKPDLALKSFGPKPPARTADPRGPDDVDEPVRVYARALEAAGQADRALAVLDVKTPTLWDQLLAIEILRRAKRIDEARVRGAALVKPLRVYQGSYGGPRLPDASRAAALHPEYVAAVAWLRETFPEKLREIEFNLGAADFKPDTFRPFDVYTLPASRLIEKLRAELAVEKDAKLSAERRRVLAETLFKSGDAAGAADVLAVSARVPRDEYGRINFDAVRWSVFRRQADAEAVYRKDPGLLTPARRLLDRLGVGTLEKGTGQRIGEMPGAADELIQLGAGVLGPALRRLSPWENLHAPHRPAYLPVVAALGGPQDAPLLIALLPDRAVERSEYDLNAVDAALRKLTGQDSSPAGASGVARRAFWLTWWDAHAATIVDAAAVKP